MAEGQSSLAVVQTRLVVGDGDCASNSELVQGGCTAAQTRLELTVGAVNWNSAPGLQTASGKHSASEADVRLRNRANEGGGGENASVRVRVGREL